MRTWYDGRRRLALRPPPSRRRVDDRTAQPATAHPPRPDDSPARRQPPPIPQPSASIAPAGCRRRRVDDEYDSPGATAQPPPPDDRPAGSRLQSRSPAPPSPQPAAASTTAAVQAVQPPPPTGNHRSSVNQASILFLTPLFSKIILLLRLQPQEFITGEIGTKMRPPPRSAMKPRSVVGRGSVNRHCVFGWLCFLGVRD
nr:hypothetical protein Iba_chr14fCG14220 [Ipomoea batatas]